MASFLIPSGASVLSIHLFVLLPTSSRTDTSFLPSHWDFLGRKPCCKKDVGGKALQAAANYPFTLSGYDKVSNLKHRSTSRPCSLDMFNETETTGAPGTFKDFPCRICQEYIKLACAGCHCCCSSMKFSAGQPCWFCDGQALSSMLLHEHCWLLPHLPGVYKIWPRLL